MKTIKLNKKELEVLDRIIVLQKQEYKNKKFRTTNKESKSYYDDMINTMEEIIKKVKC